MTVTYNLNRAAVNAIMRVAASDAQNERVLLASIPVLREQFAGWDEDTMRAAVRKNYAEAVGVALVQRGKSEVWPSDDVRTVSVKRACNRLIQRILGDDTTGKPKADDRTEIKVPRHIAELARALAEACNEYEGAKRLASTAIAQAFAK